MNGRALPASPHGESRPSSHTVHSSHIAQPVNDRSTVERPNSELAFSVRASAVVRLRPQWVWHYLSDPCNWGAVFEHLTAVSKSAVDMDEYTWSVSGQSCKVRLTVREPPQHLAWQSEQSDKLRLSGEIILEPLEWYTRLTVQLNYVTADPRLALLLQTLELGLQRDLDRLAEMLERPSCEPS